MKKVLAIAVATVGVTSFAQAQTAPPAAVDRAHVITPDQMTPQQRETVRRAAEQRREAMKKQWEALTPQEREAAIARMREGRGNAIERWESATPEQRREFKEALKERFKR